MNSVRELTNVSVNRIIPNPNQPRHYFDEENIRELAESIKELGIIQPLAVIDKGNGTYELVSGERRLRAAQLAGLQRVPCVLVSPTEEEKELIMLVENIQREDLTYIEEARAYKKIIDVHSLTQAELAEKIGKKQSTISNKLRLLRLGDEVLDRLIESNLSERHARALLSIPDTEMRLKAIDIITGRDLSVRQTEQLAEKLKSEVVLKSGSDKKNIKTVFNYKIYTNTIKESFDAIIKSGKEATYDEEKYDDRVVVKITIPFK
ncbi:MAG: ParB/RepB/Spo0J family partition protein [Anaerofustis stercorihominis]|nr:ParB/RepB/Spo0J family partition protein [Anaerofustis stercorihominis]